MAVEEEDGKGHKRRTTENKDNGRGTPQGAPISPLLANRYMRRFLLGWKQQGWDRKLQARIVNYADDFVILCRGSAASARARMERMMEQLRLRVNPQKRRTCKVPPDSFDFVGYTFGRCYRVITGEAYLGSRPSKKRVARVGKQISQMTRRHTCGRPMEEMVGDLNLVLKGWANYFQLGSVSKAYRAVDSHARNRLRRWLCGKRKLEGKGTRCYSDQYLEGTLGLIRLARFRATMPRAKAK
jgi:hypothetical protein